MKKQKHISMIMGYTKHLLFAVAVTSVLTAAAQEEQQGDSIMPPTDCPCCAAYIAAAPVANDNDSIVAALQEQVQNGQQEEEKLRQEIREKEKTIAAKEQEIEALEKHLVFADSIILRLANDCFRKEYDRERVEKAKQNFTQMYSPKLQEDFAPLKRLLNDYGAYTHELETLFKTIDGDDDFTNPYRVDDTKRKYIEAIHNTRYYKEGYKKDWTIIYLNDVVDEAINQLSALSPDEKQSPHLTPLLHH